MPLTPITVPWKEITEYQKIKSKLFPGSVQLLVGLSGLPRAAWTAALYEEIKSPVMVVTSTPEAARIFYENLAAVKPGDQVLYFPSLELLPYEVRARNTEIERHRISTLTKLSQKEPVLVVAPLQSLMRKTIPPNVFFKFTLTLTVGRRVNLSQLTSTLINMGYTKEYMVEVPGTFSTRGGIIDIFPYTEEYPFRIELFDDEIDSIRNFDLANQRSLHEKQTAMITPARELPAEPETLIKAGETLSQELEKVLPSYSGMKRRHLRDSFSPYIEQMREGLWNGGMEQFLLHIYPDAASPLEYLFDQGLVILDEPDRITQEAETVLAENHSLYFDLLVDGKILPSFAENFLTKATYKETLVKSPMLLFSHLPEDGGFDLTNKYFIPTRELPSYKGNFPRLKEDLKFYLEKGYRVVVSASSSIRVNKMKELLSDLGAERAEVIHAGFSRGFECAAIKMLLFSETDILGQTIQTKSRRRSRKGEKIATFLDLKERDYVVHVNHGIGRYLGVKRLQIGDAQRDYLYIQYSGEDKLYVPTDQVDLIQKYIGDEGHAPKLYKLGGNEWNRVKNKVRHSVQDMAKELLALYAAREAVRGHAFSPDTVWQQECEDAFPYPETPDQLRAVEEIKKDMERQKPMDRLLCGDVGYGKTEVALR
ncbi:MAG: CarD family transcriptional regulator, partial [Desulfitobacteriaceae bacterium]|nr:CarD family transcriptional regulator [Desulfitobacteriaceae bacterium]